jgi:hypothetical protein
MWVWIAFSVFVVLGAVHQSKGIKVKNSEGKIEAPQVAAGVIYADEIKANTVMAETCAISIVADSPPSRPSPRSALSRPAAGGDPRWRWCRPHRFLVKADGPVEPLAVAKILKAVVNAEKPVSQIECRDADGR